MHRVIFDPDRGQRVPLKVWARVITPETLALLQQLASQPYVVGFVAAMADAHVAERVAVGTVFATESTVVPGALGGDLGCGMSALRLTEATEPIDRHRLQRLVARLGQVIPAGDAQHRHPLEVPGTLMATALSTKSLEHTRCNLAPRHLGTLGGGNHFLELDRDPEGALWLLVHSGSRGLGAAIAHHHARVAETRGETTATSRTSLGPSFGATLPGLSLDTEQGQAYWRDLHWALDFARANRASLLTVAQAIVAEELGVPLSPGEVLDVHHNFAAREVWNGRSLIVHRKGAVAVPEGGLALVPGSMGTASYIVEGLGNPDALGSCSHGAGRVLTRTAARRAISPEALGRVMRHVVYPSHLAKRLVEEAPAAYREIREVLEEQKDLVRRRVRLEPVAVLKG